MNRSLAILLALLLASISIGTAGLATELGAIRFDVAAAGADRVQLSLRHGQRGTSDLSSSFTFGDLAGLHPAFLREDVRSPVRFSLVREAGHLDCNGRSVGWRATGSCRFQSDASFAAFLTSHGVTQPSEQQLLGMTVVGTRRSLVQALSDGGFRRVTPDDLLAMTALDVTPSYIRDMAAYGYRPANAGEFVPLKALDVSPAYIRSLAAVGYRSIPVGQLLQLKALNVTADFIVGFQRRGYYRLPVTRLVQLKALNITPEELGAFGGGGTGAGADELSPLKLNRWMP